MFTATRYCLHARVFSGLHSLILAISLSLCAPASFAEHADRDKPLLLEADQVLIDDMHKTSTFTGNVRLAQGTMLIRGDKIEVLKSSDGFQQTKAYGNTASFRQKREGSEEYLEGYGERIEYDTRTGTVDFYGQARVKRELDEVRGDHITYSMKTETFQVSAGASPTNAPPKRVRAVLQPRPKSDVAAPSNQVLPDGTPGRTSATPE
ncbi:MAG: lipopolysaccharide transport periplasmic protein LptA [Pseudomonadota bacterium]